VDDAMGALRKAGVWLGLVEEVDEPFEVDDEFADEEEDFVPAARPRPLSRAASTSPTRSAESRNSERDLRAEYRRAEGRRLGLGGDRTDPESRAERRLVEPRAAEPRGGDPRAAESRSNDPRGAEPRESRLEREAREVRADRDAWSSRVESYPDRPAADPARATPPPREEPRSTVRQLSRPSASGTQVSYPTHDNLALAPQVQLRERAVVGEEKSRRYQITTLHLTSYSEARTIGEHFRDGFPVIMNLTEMDEPDAKRLVDFAAGLAFALRGSMERVTNRVFLLSPPNIQVSAEDKAKIAEGGFFDQD
jgi:cell division inhibitor SepF